MPIDPNDPHVKDTRSPLAKALGDRGIAVHILDLYDGTGHDLDGIPMALRTVSNAIRVKATADALRFLTGPQCGMTEEYLYGTDSGRGEMNLELMVQLLAVALVEPAPPHRPIAKDADTLRQLLDATEIQQIFDVYGDWLAERNPLSHAKSMEEVDAVLAALGKGTIPASRLTSFDSSTLRSALASLAVRLARLTSSSSLLSPPSTDTAETPTSDD